MTPSMKGRHLAQGLADKRVPPREGPEALMGGRPRGLFLSRRCFYPSLGEKGLLGTSGRRQAL